MNTIYFGDNLDVLRKHIKDESVDLIYLDPPFNSNKAYNIIYGKGEQIKAFDDTWHWGEEAEKTFEEITTKSKNQNIVDAIKAFREMLGTNNLMAYLVMMTIRLIELHRVLKPTGSIYLHCDPTASHYLKIIMDNIFGVENFRNEIVWCYTGPSTAKKDFARKHDVILKFSKTNDYLSFLDSIRIPYKELHTDKGKDGIIKGFGKLQDEKIRQEYIERGKILEDYWLDIPSGGHISPKERTGYPTQKPEALLERIIKASCPPDGIVLDPFCGGATTMVVAEKLKRKWIGIDITYLSVGLLRKRLEKLLKAGNQENFKVVMESV